MEISSIADGLNLGKDGIWYASEMSEVSYPASGTQICYAIEDRSFWFRHRNRCIVSVVESFPPTPAGPILDIGAGNGFVSLGLARAGFEVVSLEPFRAGALNARDRGLAPVICSTFEGARFKNGSLPAVGLFDVIEHLEDDLGFLQSLRRALTDGGRVYATVPAYQTLWSDADIRAGHHRRYGLEALESLFGSAGLKVEFASYFFRFLPLGIFVTRTLPYRAGITRSTRTPEDISRDHGAKGGLVSKVLSLLHNSEVSALRERKRIPFGGSCILVARKTLGGPESHPGSALEA